VERVILFGSYARGEETPLSDIDLYLDGSLAYRVDDSMDTESRVAEALHAPVGLLTRSALQGSVIRESLETAIRQDGVLLYE
jgi:predicted nucleotidyltransferase